MIAFEISHNGKRICTAGLEEAGILVASLAFPMDRKKQKKLEFPLHLHVAGLDNATEDHLHWDTPDMKLGDSVTIKIVDADKIDLADSRQTPEELENDGCAPPKKKAVRSQKKVKKAAPVKKAVTAKKVKKIAKKR